MSKVIVKVGNTVYRRGTWGKDAPEKVIITDITLCDFPHMKDGLDVDEVELKDLSRSILGFNTNNWSYGVHTYILKDDAENNVNFNH